MVHFKFWGKQKNMFAQVSNNALVLILYAVYGQECKCKEGFKSLMQPLHT